MNWTSVTIIPNEIRIAVVDDEPVVQETLVAYLQNEGFRVAAADSASGLKRLLDRVNFDLVLMDIRLPDGDGLALMREIQERSRIPVILVTSKTAEADRVVGLELGADDYITKPFSMRELLARVHSVLRRTARPAEPPLRNKVRHFAGWSLNLDEHWLKSPEGDSIRLTHAEFALLEALVLHPFRVMSRSDLIEAIGDHQWNPQDRTIDVLVARLRRKIEVDPADPKMILTEYRLGYVFAEPVT
ncbi:response regulator transcription factor [Consotaella aegiceratis]|uniref:response regulator transcription factor n=1 Tax=Consotaella aegiceratis TaxID=3097961 RepID=UPI002F3E8BEA